MDLFAQSWLVLSQQIAEGLVRGVIETKHNLDHSKGH